MFSLSKEFENMFESIASLSTKNIKATPLQLSTMTFSGKFNMGNIPIHSIREAMKDSTSDYGGVTIAVPKVVKHRKNTVIRETNMKKFDHQVSFNVGTTSLKVFFNGSVHGTGFSSIADFVNAAQLVAKAIQSITELELELDLADISTNLINISTSVVDNRYLPVNFNMKKLADAFLEQNIHADFNPEQHPAVKIIFSEDKKKVCTAFVFPTGSVSIFGSKEPKYISQMYNKLFSTMDKYSHLAKNCDFRKTTLKTHVSISHGYPSSSINLIKQ